MTRGMGMIRAWEGVSVDLAWADFGRVRVHGMQWSHEFDLVACGFYLFLGGVLPNPFLSSFLAFISLFCEALSCMLLVLKDDQMPIGGVFLRGLYISSGDLFWGGGYL